MEDPSKNNNHLLSISKFWSNLSTFLKALAIYVLVQKLSKESGNKSVDIYLYVT
jgi:hypothetical protein